MLKWFCLWIFVKYASTTNILLVSPIISPSHHLYNKALAVALSEKGHNVTMIGNDPEKYKSNNFHYILMEGVYEYFFTEIKFDVSELINVNSFVAIMEMYGMSTPYCTSCLKSKGLKQLMDYPEDFNFDLVIYDATMNQCLYGLIDRFKRPPAVGVTAFLLAPYMANAMGSHLYPSYYPHYNLQVTNRMSFFERMQSFLQTYFEIFYRNRVYSKKQDEFMKEYFGPSVRTAEEHERSLALLLSNTDPILDYPVPLPPNIIPVGGMHIKPSGKLPEDLAKILNNAKDGVILFSLGTNIQSSLLGSEMRDEFLAAFSKLNQTVIWKYEKQIDNLPKNVVIRKWLPQNDILGHKNCKLFISHGGGLSTQEALYHGVPIVGIPGFADQHKNVKKFVEKKLAVQLNFQNIKKDIVFQAIQEVLTNPAYKDNIQRLSKEYHDQPQTPLERAIFWCEYVIRHHGGAKSLETPARDMCFFETTNLDVVSFLIAVPTLILFVIFKLMKKLFRPGNARKDKKLKKN